MNVISNIWNKKDNYEAAIVRGAVKNNFTHQFNSNENEYLVYYDTDNVNVKGSSHGYLRYLSSYYLFSNEVNLLNNNLEVITQTLKSANSPLYLVVLNDDSTIKNFMDAELNLTISQPGIYQLGE